MFMLPYEAVKETFTFRGVGKEGRGLEYKEEGRGARWEKRRGVEKKGRVWVCLPGPEGPASLLLRYPYILD